MAGNLDDPANISPEAQPEDSVAERDGLEGSVDELKLPSHSSFTQIEASISAPPSTGITNQTHPGAGPNDLNLLTRPPALPEKTIESLDVPTFGTPGDLETMRRVHGARIDKMFEELRSSDPNSAATAKQSHLASSLRVEASGESPSSRANPGTLTLRGILDSFSNGLERILGKTKSDD